MPVTRSPILQTRETVERARRRKPPACDPCKARRVLCHPTMDGTACPRCLEKGTKCITTPVARGRPPKTNLGAGAMTVSPAKRKSSAPHSKSHPNSHSNPHSNPHSHPNPHLTSEEPESESVSNASLPPQDFNRYLELSPELVHHLLECFTHLPQNNHPMYRGIVLRDTLSSVSWQIHLLPPQLKVLAHCVVALSASISFVPAIIGPGPSPQSLADRSVFTRGADLRAYGVRRAPMYRALCAEAIRLALEVGILLEPSEDNAVSCFIIQFLEENEKDTLSRPWAVAYLSHVRAILGAWDQPNGAMYKAALWTGFLLIEVVETTQRRQPVLVSHHDQLLITGREPTSLQSLFVSIQSALQERKEGQQHIPFPIIQPYLVHVTRLARQLYETITGDFARRQPLDESAITSFISALTLLQSIRCLVFEFDAEGPDAGDFFCLAPQKRGMYLNLRACAHIMTFSRATLVLALHRELVRRAPSAPSSSHAQHGSSSSASAGVGDTAMGAGEQWAAERLSLLCRQVREMAEQTVQALASELRSMPSLPHIAHLQRGMLADWAEFCLAGADAVGGVGKEQAVAMETISNALKLVGYSWLLPAGLVERLDAYVEAHRPVPPLYNAEAEDAMFMDMFPAALDNNWMAMFGVPLPMSMPMGNSAGGVAGGGYSGYM
ncbi:hypothetical protein DFH06DRAFT_1204537 [Mycena polygramma]|nr:hypothetical protein DFH06DRAFT_1204537 [Mycena polygramma]